MGRDGDRLLEPPLALGVLLAEDVARHRVTATDLALGRELEALLGARVGLHLGHARPYSSRAANFFFCCLLGLRLGSRGLGLALSGDGLAIGVGGGGPGARLPARRPRRGPGAAALPAAHRVPVVVAPRRRAPSPAPPARGP